MAAVATAMPDDLSFGDIPFFLTPEQLSELTGQTPASIRRGIKEKRIVADKINGRWRIPRDTIFKNSKEALAHGSEA